MRLLLAGMLLVLLASGPPAAAAQESATLRVRVVAPDSSPVAGAQVRSRHAAGRTDEAGVARLVVPAGPERLTITRLGFAPTALELGVRAGLDTTVRVVLLPRETVLADITVAATRSERRIEDEPVRVEVLGVEEVEEKLLMTPGDITMMLNETAGLRVQVTSPSSGGATVRVQGLRGRYTQVLADGLPLYGGQAGGLGLLQIPPMDLGGVEVIKGVASALYGGTALGGVVNLQSRRPSDGPIREALLNGTTLGGTDAVLFVGDAIGRGEGGEAGWSYTLLAGTHGQRQQDRDQDGWTDLPGYARGVLRPRLFVARPGGGSGMLTAGTTFESRNGGTMPGATAPNGLPHPERLQTRRADVGGTYRTLAGATGLVNLRGSFATQAHRHVFGGVEERDRHDTWFVEGAYTRGIGAATLVLGAAVLGERYRSRDVEGFDFSHATPGAFAQVTTDLGERLSGSASARVDRHSAYGTFFSPRVSLLYRVAGAWVMRASVGSGFFGPTPFTEETEVVGLSAMRPLDGIRAERARGGSLDVGGSIGPVELNLTAFGSVIRDPVGVRDAMTALPRVELVNLGLDTRTVGGELLARWDADPFRVTLTYTQVQSSEGDPETGVRRAAALVPRQQAGLVTTYEREGALRAGVELYYTGRQPLDEDSYRSQGRPYLYIGALVEKVVGRARVFLNAENLLDVRQTDWDPLVRPFIGRGGRWTNDVWAPLDGLVVNAGVRWQLPGLRVTP